MNAPVVEVEDLRTRLAGRWVHDGVSFALRPGEIVALIGGSGTGKTVLLNQLVGLRHPDGGRVKLFGHDLADYTQLLSVAVGSNRWEWEQDSTRVLAVRAGLPGSAVYAILRAGQEEVTWTL